MNTAFAVSKPAQTQPQYPSGSWGVGVVVPEGARFTDGGLLSWTNVTTVTATVTLPSISFTDYPTLAILSLMAEDGSVMQIAAGIFPNETNWLGYGWYITHIQSNPQNYVWVLNASKPKMAVGTTVSLSIYLHQRRWRYRIENLSTHDATEGDYTSNPPPVLKEGDQEVFALESYSTSSEVFAHMGNLTLNALRIDGREVATGWYPYGSWDTRHNPLFVVGGLDPPPYITLQEEADATLVWSYEQWSGPAQAIPQISPLTILLGIPELAAALVFLILYTRRKARNVEPPETGPPSRTGFRHGFSTQMK